MSTAKHTPGPWHHDTRGYPHPDVKAANGRNIACTWGVNNQPKTPGAAKAQKEIARANARLIAAAPELLAELINCRNELACLAAELRSSVTVPGTEEILDDEDRSLCEFEESRVARLDALIAKATGAKP